MKYLILGPNHAVRRIRDDEPPATVSFVSVADEVADVAAVLIADETKSPIWIEGELSTREDLKEAGFRVRWDDESKKLVRVAIPVPTTPVPQEVPLWAFRQVLLEDNLLATVQAAVAGNVAATNFLEYGNFVDRSSPALASIAAAIGKSSEEVDAFFIRAAAIRL